MSHVEQHLIEATRVICKENGISAEHERKLLDILEYRNNFRASTSWKQQYEFMTAMMLAYAINLQAENTDV